MNKGNGQKLIDAIENEVMGFRMTDWIFIEINDERSHSSGDLGTYHGYVDEGNVCRTVCCIAGTAALLSGEQEGDVEDVATQWLDITQGEATWLFMGHFSGRFHMSDITRNEACRAIKWLVDGKGTVAWDARKWIRKQDER